MEISGVRNLLAHTGDEKYQMLELNKRLETYLNHVKLLEEENHLLWGEIQALRRNQDSGGQRKAQVEALSLARREVQNSWREKDCVELEISNLLDEIEELNTLRQKERAAQAEAKRKLEESRKMLEDERRLQIWLREKAGHLERELSIQVKVHQEDMTALKSSLSNSKPVLMAPQHNQPLNLQGLAQEYSQKASHAWREATGTYQKQVEKLEESLMQSRSFMDQISQEKKESQLQLQGLARELENMKVKREFLEKNMAKQRDSQTKELQHFQAHIETLEIEKVDIEEQIGELLVDRRNLLQMKMSLGIEVATYRALMDNESLRANKQSTAKKTLTVLEGITKTHGKYPGTQTHLGISSCLSSSPLKMPSRSITFKPSLMTQAPSWPLTRSTTQETPKNPKEEEILINNKTTNLESSPATLTKPSTRAGSQFHYEPNDAHNDARYVAEDKPDSILSPRFLIESNNLVDTLEREIDSQQVLSGSNETDVIISQTLDKEVSSSLHMADAKCSEDGDEEVSTEIAQISHAPMSAWEETDTTIVDERDVISELESENITETSMQEFRLDAGPTELKESAINTNVLPSSLSTNSLNYDEETSEMMTWTDVNESVIHFAEEESLKSIERESVQWTEEAEGTDTEVLKCQDFDPEEHEEMNIDRQVEQRKEEENTSGTEQSLTMKATASMDGGEKEEEGIINNSTQELRLDAGFTKCMQPGENTITLAPSLTEDTPLSTPTFRPDEEILGVKENIFHFAEKESLKSAPGIERESVEGTKEFEHTGSEVFKHHYYDTEEHKENREDRQLEQRKEEEGTEQQSLIMEVTASMHEDKKEVETINNNTQEFLLDARLKELAQPGEISPDEETSEILTWADVKESVIHFVEEESLQSAPEIKQESEETKEVEGTSTEMFKGHNFDFEEHEKNEDKEVEQRKEDETNAPEQQSLIMEVTASMNNSPQECLLDAGLTECKQPGENAITPTLSLTKDTPLSVHTFSPDEETSEILDVEENVIHFVEEESLKTALETERESVKGTKDDSNLSEMLKGHDFDFEEHEEKNEDSEVEQRKEEKETNDTEQQSMIMEVTASMHEVEKEVETMINNSTQDFQLDTGLKEFIEPGDKTTSVVEYTPLSAHTYSPDEETSEILDVKEADTHFAEEESLKRAPEIETESVEVINDESEILTWADGKEHVINSESQKSTPETERESVEGAEEVDSTLTEVLKGHGFGTEKHEEKKEDNEMEHIKTREDTNGIEQQSLIMDVTASMNNTEKEVEAIINNDTQEFRLDTGFKDFKQPNTVTLAPSLTEGTPLSAHTFSSDEENSEILTGADVKENAIHFIEEETLKSAPDFERDTMKTTEEVRENTVAELPGAVMLKGQEFEKPNERYLTYSEADDEQSEQRKDADVIIGIKNKELTEEVNAVMDNNEKEGTIQSSSDLQGDPDGISENPEQNGMGSYGRNNQLEEYHAEEEHEQSEDESMNISGSWKTDPGETDSYARENTLADTRPLIHYKSEEEMDADTKISHLEMRENNDSEGEGEKQEGEGHWSQKIAKRFDTMEDLSEEPEMCNVDDVVTHGLVHTVIEAHEEEREILDVMVSEGYVQPVDESLLEREVGGLMDAALVNDQESELINNMEKSTHSKEETMQENTLVDKKHEENSQFQDTREVNEILPAEQSNNSKDDITKDMVETRDVETPDINPEQEAKAHLNYIPFLAETPVAETPQEQTLEEPYELTFETAMIKEQACLKEEDEQSNLSLLTHADLTDSFSQHSGLSSRPESYTADSDQEVSNSSDDESPNASRCSQIRPHLDVPTQHVDWMSSSDGVLEKDSEKEKPKVEFVKDSQVNLQTEELETVRNQNKEQKQCTGSSGVDENAGSQINEYDDVECASHSIRSTVQEHGTLKTENKDEVGVFQGDDLNESEARDKQNDPHSFFSSSIKEGIWSTPQFEMAATFDPLDQTETEKDSRDNVYPNQSTAFREGLRNLESLTSNNGKSENETRISLAQSVLKEREDQNVQQAKKLQCRNTRDEVEEEVHSGDSTDEGDSWSSGEE